MIHCCRSNTQRRHCVCVGPTTPLPYDDNVELMTPDGSGDDGNDDEPETLGKTVRPSFVRVRLQNPQP